MTAATVIKRAVVIGANRGIGLQLTKGLLARQWTVTGTVRQSTAEQTDEVRELKETGAAIINLDFLKENSIKDAVKAYGDGPLDLLINCGGIGPLPDNWHEHTAEGIMLQFQTNALGPFLATRHFYPNLKQSPLAKVVNMGSRAASLSQNKGEDLGYRMSKSALNQMSITLAREFAAAGDQITVVSIYPGYLPTRLSEWRSRDNMEESITGFLDVIEKLDMSHTGQLLNWKNETMPF